VAGKHRILIIRLGAMGDILHTLPAAASLRKSFPDAELMWAVAPKWMPLLMGNPAIDRIVPFERKGTSRLLRSWKTLRKLRPEVAIDFQGLLQSALVARASRPMTLFGWSRKVAREPMASLLYTKTVLPTAAHIIDRNLELATAAGARWITYEQWIPDGRAEGTLPERPFVLAHPFAGWMSKQWPIGRYEDLGRLLESDGIALVVNVSWNRADELRALRHVQIHSSSLAGLIHATRRAVAVLGLDSGPLHLAAALAKPGVALFGPTDPARNGPYGASIRVLRHAEARTTYKRGDAIDPSMAALTVDQVYESLLGALKAAKPLA
jgi:heptosyltransferase-1